MTSLLRLVRCLLGIASPSRTVILLAGGASPMATWLDRWEHRINEDAARRFVPVVRRDEVQFYSVHTGHVFQRVDVTGRSNRAQRRVRNKWRRRLEGGGFGVRLITIYS